MSGRRLGGRQAGPGVASHMDKTSRNPDETAKPVKVGRGTRHAGLVSFRITHHRPGVRVVERRPGLGSVLVSFIPVQGRSPVVAGRLSAQVTYAGGRW